MAGAPSRLLFLTHRRLFHLFRSPLRHSLPTTTNHRLTSFTPTKFIQTFHSTPTTFAWPENYHDPDHQVHTSHPWPEWLRLLQSIAHFTCFNPNTNNIENEFIPNENLPTEFVNAGHSCLAFARDWPHILSWLPRKDIQVVIDNGYPFLFKNGQEIERRMRSFVQAGVLTEATLVDLMKYVLSYASNPIIYPERNIKEGIESSVRNLLQAMDNVSDRGRGQMGRTFGPHITMKKGDWICFKCNFINFARNTQCLECEELRPQRQLTGGDWDCPRCNFFNYRKNVVCLKCECRRPDEGGYNSSTSEISNTYVQSSLIQNTEKEERTERWFKKVKELHGVTDPTSSASNDDFSQITPIRKEENHFVGNMNKDSLSSPYQGRTSSFVPFPPNYFAKNNIQQQPKSVDSAASPTSENFYSNNGILNKNIMHGTGNQQMSDTNNLDSRSSIGNRTVFNGDMNTPSYSNQFRRNEPMPEGNRTMFNGHMNTDSSNERFRRNEPTPESDRTNFSEDMNTYPSRNQFRRNEHTPEGNRTMFSGDMNTIPSNDPFRRNEPKPELNRSIYSGDMNTDSSTNQFRRNEPMPEGNRTVFSGDMNTNLSSNQLRRNEPRPEIGQQTPESMNPKGGWTGKSLEGSAVTEPDPLDMSEEAKAERWFRRVAQIKDISELSQIPDEDFPSIMPMRKGVNRFVVSKRKTPLERRLTSPQYRKNLRIMSSNPMKNEGNDDD